MTGEPLDVAVTADALPEWTVAADALTRSVTAPTFLAAIDWVVAIAARAEAMDHHPDIDIRWRTLHLTLSTHSAGHATDKDVALAREIDAIVQVR